jgi:hypothetical protein
MHINMQLEELANASQTKPWRASCAVLVLPSVYAGAALAPF